MNSDLLRELTLSRDRLLIARGARDQASRAVEAARAAYRRAVEELESEEKTVARLEAELKHGPDRHPLLFAIETNAAGRNGADPANLEKPGFRDSAPAASPPDPPKRGRRPTPGAAGGGDTSRERSELAGVPGRTDPDDDADDAPGPVDYDRLVAAGVAAAEARRAATNGHPIDRHLERVDRLAASGTLELPPEDGEAPAADWRAVPMRDALAAIGPAGTRIVEHLADEWEVETAGDLAEMLLSWHLDELEPDPAERSALRDALETFRSERGWDEKTLWPEGIPAAWIEPDDDQADDEPPPPPPPPAGKPARKPEERRPGETVRQARERRKAEKAAALRQLRGPEVAREGIAAIDAARQDLAERRAGKAVPREAIEPPGSPPLLSDGHEVPGWRAATLEEWQSAAPADRSPIYRLVRERPDGSPVAAEEPAASQKPRGTHKPSSHDSAPASPAERAQEPADVTRAGDVAVIREAIDEIEGPTGDGSRTRICSRCKRGFEARGATCPACGWRISRVAIGLLVELGAVAPASRENLLPHVATFVPPPRGGIWDGASLRDAAAELGMAGIGLRVCNRCDAAVVGESGPCPGCEYNAFRRVFRRNGELAVPEKPAAGRANGAARRKRAKGRKEAARATD